MPDEVDLLDWPAVGKRITDYRTHMSLTSAELAKRAGLNESTVTYIENGRPYRTLNPLWAIIRSERVSSNWLLKGLGSMLVSDSSELPVTLIRKRGAGVRRSEARLIADKGEHEGDVLEFILAVESYKRLNNRPFPALSELFELFQLLGYRKVVAPSINPLQQMKEAKRELANTPVST